MVGTKIQEIPWLTILEQTIEGLQEGVHVVDSEGTTILYNKACGKMEGLEPQDAIGRKILDIYPSLSKSTSVLFKVMETGEPVENLTQTFTNFRGRVINTVNSSYPILHGKKIWGAIEISQDVNATWEISGRMIDLQAKIRKQAANSPGSAAVPGNRGFEAIITVSPEMKRVIDRAHQAARVDSPVLICGETGTGKELFVHAIHEGSHRGKGPLITQNCAALPETLLEAALFGTKIGAFTGAQDKPGLAELADGGTLYLDELVSAPLSLQAKLLRFLEDKMVRRVGGTKTVPVDVRVVASLSMPPEEAIAKSLLRRDFYYRLAVIYLEIPPLRQRKGDIPVLAGHFLQDHADLSMGVKRLSADALSVLMTHDWRGNVRELKNILEGAMCLTDDDVIEPRHLSLLRKGGPVGITSLPEFSQEETDANNAAGLQTLVLNYERRLIEESLIACNGNMAAAARALPIPRQTLWSKIKRLGLGTSLCSHKD